MANNPILTSTEVSKEYESSPPDEKAHISQILIKRRNLQIQPLLPNLSDSSDIPKETDRANRHELVREIADRIITAEKITSFSINGPWGSGKSVMMRWLNEELRKRKEVRVLYFEAWKYEGLSNLIQPLIMQMKREEGFDESLRHFDKSIGSLAVLAGSIYATTHLGLEASASISINSLIWKLLRRPPSMQDQIKSIDELHTEFPNLVSTILDSYVSKPRKMVFLIDELDRCSATNIVTLLESIKNYLETERTSFVFAIDRKVIGQAISSKYGRDSGIDGDEYLEKIIQFSYELPFDATLVSKGLINELLAGTNAASLNYVFFPTICEIAGVKSIRTIKKIINRFGVLHERCFREIQGQFNPQVLLLLVFLYEVFPDVYEVLSHSGRAGHIDQIQGFKTDTFKNRGDQSPVLRRLIEMTYERRIPELISEFKKMTGEASRNIHEDSKMLFGLLTRFGA